MTAAEFKKKWSPFQGKETSAYQGHFDDVSSYFLWVSSCHPLQPLCEDSPPLRLWFSVPLPLGVSRRVRRFHFKDSLRSERKKGGKPDASHKGRKGRKGKNRMNSTQSRGDAALRQPQYIFRGGRLFVLTPTEPNAGFNPPEGHFSDAYPLDDERERLEKASLKVPQSILRSKILLERKAGRGRL